MPDLYDRYDPRPVADHIVAPPFAELSGRSRRRKHRNQVAAAGGAAVLAALVAVPVLGQAGDGAGLPAAMPSPPPVVSVASSVTFYDGLNGYVDLTTHRQGSGCNNTLLATGDGGQTWSGPRDLPRVTADMLPVVDVTQLDIPPEVGLSCRRPAVVVIGPETLVMLVTLETRAGREWVHPPETAFISHDAGQTWQEYRPRMQEADVVPAGVTPKKHCEDTACEQMRIGWYDPQTGDRVALAGELPTVVSDSGTGVTTAPDGSIWVTGLDGDGRSCLVSVSQDRGDTWTTTPLDQATCSPDHSPLLAASDGATAYLSGGTSAAPAHPDPLFRTTDGGVTWQRLDGDRPFDGVRDLHTGRDGTLLVVDDNWDLFVSADRGHTFRPVDMPVVDPTPVQGGLLGWKMDDPSLIEIYLSEDGLNWRPVQVPLP